MNSPYEQALDRIDSLTASRDQIEQDFYRLRDELSATRNELTDTQKSLRDCIKDADRYETLWTEACDKLREKDETIKNLNNECGSKSSNIYALRANLTNMQHQSANWQAEAEQRRDACRAKDADIDSLTASRDQIEQDLIETQKRLRECGEKRDLLDKSRTHWMETANKWIETNQKNYDALKNMEGELDFWKRLAEDRGGENEWREMFEEEKNENEGLKKHLRNLTKTRQEIEGELAEAKKDTANWQAEAERWRKLSENTSLGRIEELEAAVNRWETACREKDADIDKLLAQRDQAFAERDNMQHQRDELSATRNELSATRNELADMTHLRDRWRSEAGRWCELAAKCEAPERVEELESKLAGAHHDLFQYSEFVRNIAKTAGWRDPMEINLKMLEETVRLIVENRDTERRRANHNAEIAVEREEECQRLHAHIQKQHVASWHLIQDALGTDFRVNGNSLVEDTVNAINGFRDACELLDLIHDATNLREEVEP